MLAAACGVLLAIVCVVGLCQRLGDFLQPRTLEFLELCVCAFDHQNKQTHEDKEEDTEEDGIIDGNYQRAGQHDDRSIS